MKKYPRTSKRSGFGIFIVFVTAFAIMCLAFSADTGAWFSKRSRTENKIKVLSKMQRKKIAKSLVRTLLQDDFFKKHELPRKLALAEIKLIGPHLGTNGEDFTNRVLNDLLSYRQVIVVNQDLKTDLSMEYQLMHYLPAGPVRKKGILLGADYYVSGFLKSETIVNDKGRATQQFVSGLFVRDIRTNKMITKATYEYKKEKSKKRK